MGLVVALGGCYGGASDGDDADGGGTQGTDDGSGDGGDDGPPASQCGDETLEVGLTPLRRLTRTEYNNTIRDLLGDDGRPADAFVPDEQVGGFGANTMAPVAQLDVENYIDAAEAIAASELADVDAWLACDRDQDACVVPWLEDLAMRAYRRPPTTREAQDLVAVYTDARDQWGGDVGVELALATVLASPQFIYHVELGGSPAQGAAAVALQPYELAARLSYFVWSTMPDQELFAAAEAETLGTRGEIEAQVRRMLDDPKFGGALDSFHDQWLELEHLDGLAKDATLFPQWSQQLADAMRTETLAFTQDVIRDGDATVATLLTAPHSFVDDQLAALYGVAAPATAFDRVELDPTERAGLLTQPSFLAVKAHENSNSWVYRGRFVRARLLCESLPPPPPGVNFNEGNNPSRLENPDCASCHTLMDPIGWGFDDYDAIGGYADEGAQGEVIGSDVAGTFDSVTELAGRLAQSEQVTACFADTWFTFASRRLAAAEDACSVETSKQAFADAGYDIRELIVAIATSDAFRYRPVGGGQ